MTTASTPTEDNASPPCPEDFESYSDYLANVRRYKRLRLIDVVNASAHPDYPASKAKKSTLSRMEAGAIKNPSFRQIIYCVRGYGVTFEDLTTFFKEEYRRAQR